MEFHPCPHCGHLHIKQPAGKCPVCQDFGNNGAPCACPYYRFHDGRLVGNLRSMSVPACKLHHELVTPEHSGFYRKQIMAALLSELVEYLTKPSLV